MERHPAPRGRVGRRRGRHLALAALSLPLAALSESAEAATTIVVPVHHPTVQAAVNAASPGDTIIVRAGTFTEQLTIGKSLTIVGAGSGSTTIQAPAVLAPRVIGPFPGLANIVEVFGGASVTIRGVGVSGPAGTSCLGLAGVTALDGATLRLESSAVRGCTSDAVRVGFPTFSPIGPSVGHAVITGDDIRGARISGIRVDGPGTTGVVSASKVVMSPSPLMDSAIRVLDHAWASVTGTTASGALCVDEPICGPDFINQIQGVGIAAINAAPGSVFSQNTITGNDLGLFLFRGSGCCQLRQNTLRDNRYFGVGVADGAHTLSSTTISGSAVGVVAGSFDFDTTATLANVVITGATTPVQELSCCGAPAKVQGTYFVQ
jgi:hypothetical protein